MIVEQRVRCIVGIFNEQDLKKMKCPTYWPTSNKKLMTLSPLYDKSVFLLIKIKFYLFLVYP